MSKQEQRIKDLEARLACESQTRQTVEESLRESEARFDALARNLTGLVLAYDMERHLTFVNEAVHTLTGYSRAEIDGQGCHFWAHPEDRGRMAAHWERLFEGHGFYDAEYRLLTKDGRVKWMTASWSPVLDGAGRQVGAAGREWEVTGQRMADETLRAGEESPRELFEDSPFPMWEEDFSGVKQYLDGLRARGVTGLRAYLAAHRTEAEECARRIRVLDVNRAAREFYSASREQLLGDLNQIFDDTAYEVFCEEMEALYELGATFRTEFETRRMTGELRTITMIVAPRPSPSDWSRVIVSFFDITDHKRLQQQALQSQRLESLGRLASGIAHDFNNLLMVVSGYSDLLLSDTTLSARVRAGLNEIRGAGQRGVELTRQLLAFSRKQAGQPRALDLNGLIRESQSMLERVLGEDIEARFQLHPEAWTVRADRSQIHQVLMNLVLNARDAMPDGGTLTIETDNVAEAGREYLRVSVSDTGAGMDDVTRQHVFEPFFMPKSGNRGTGLGLATVFGIVTQAGGHVTVDSEPGRGSVFHMNLPRLAAASAAGAAASARRTARQPVASSHAGTVLLVEDQEEVRRLTGEILRKMGFHVLEAAGAREGIAEAESYSGEIQLMLTDVVMPIINGRELAERISQIRPRTKVIFMSGYTNRIMSIDGVLDDSVAYLQKPFTAEQLDATIRRVLG